MLSHIIFGLFLLGGEHTRLVFETNKDQAPADVRYLLQTEKYRVDFKRDEIVFHFGSNSMRVRFAGRPNWTMPAGRARLDRLVRYIDSDDRKSKTDIPKFASVKYESLYSGIDLSCRGHAGQLECVFLAMPGADPEQIRFAVEGTDRIEIDETGALHLEIAGQTLRVQKPNAFQLGHGRRNIVDVRFELKGSNEIAFSVGPYNSSIPLIFDLL
jgi:hypothetical protein